MLEVMTRSSGAENGFTQTEISEKAKTERIPNPFEQLGDLIKDGYVLFDERPAPGRFKATKKAWNTVLT